MRFLPFLAVLVAALASSACGAPVSDTGNAWVTESALASVGTVADGATTVRLVSVSVDVDDPGCSIDGIRFSGCTFTNSATEDFDGPLNLCDLQVGSDTNYVWECEVGEGTESRIGRIEELPAHCPSSGGSRH